MKPSILNKESGQFAESSLHISILFDSLDCTQWKEGRALQKELLKVIEDSSIVDGLVRTTQSSIFA